MDILAHNRAAWDRKVDEHDRWTVPVCSAAIERARCGDIEIVLTPTKVVPKSWFPELKGAATLCLASGGGQQGPLLAAAGADVTVFDNSPKQLATDRLVAAREGLTIKTVEGDMADLSCFSNDTFQLIVHPCSNCFVPDARPVWRECFRVLRAGGILLAGFANPVRYLFDDKSAQGGNLQVRYSVPYSPLSSLHAQDHSNQEPLDFGHTLADQIGGQLDAGFVLVGFYEDRYDQSDEDPISRYIDSFVATRALKP